MGARRHVPILLAAAVLAVACGEQPRDTVTGPEFKPSPPPGTCDFGALPGLVRNYFPGPRQTPIVNLVGSMQTAGQQTPDARTFGFQIMDSIGFLSRDPSVTTVPSAGAELTLALINNCMFDASGFTYPTTPLADFTKALTQHDGGAYYVRGGTAARENVVLGTKYSETGDPTNLSGITPSSGTWASLVQSSASENRALFFGYLVGETPLVYEWATVPSATTFDPAAMVAVCDNTGSSTTAMVNESNIGILAFADGGTALCGQTQQVVMTQPGWGPKALATRLARAVIDAVAPTPLHATLLLTKTGTGSTASTFKSKFSTNSVTSITFTFTQAPKNIFRSQPPVTLIVQATTSVDGVTTGVNGVCVYVTGANNNGVNTALTGHQECDNTPNGGISAKTRSQTVGGQLAAGYAVLNDVTVTKTGGLVLTASSSDGTNITGVVGRDGQTFVNAIFKTNVKP